MSLEVNVATMRWYRAYFAKRAANAKKRRLAKSFEGKTFFSLDAFALSAADEALKKAAKEESRTRRALLKACQKIDSRKGEPLCIDI